METVIKKKYKQITPSDGNVLTQANIENESERTFCTTACIPLTMNESTWTEWTESQVKQWKEGHPMEEYEDEEYQ